MNPLLNYFKAQEELEQAIFSRLPQTKCILGWVAVEVLEGDDLVRGLTVDVEDYCGEITTFELTYEDLTVSPDFKLDCGDEVC